LVLVPRAMLATVMALIDGDNEQKPLWSLDDDDENVL